MKTKLLSLASMLAAFNLNAIEIGPTGSGVELSGFIDIASSDQGTNNASTTAQVELNLSFANGPVSGAVGLDFGEGSVYGGSGNMEEAYVTYDFGNGLSVTGGRMLTYMGYEAFDPTNMYQFSYAYDVMYVAGLTTAGGQDVYDAYDYGASIDYGTDAFSIGVWSSLETNAGYELALAFTGIENFTAKAIWSDFSDGGYEKATYWVQYQLDKLLLAVEFAESDEQAGAFGGGAATQTGKDIDGMMIMANYAVSDSAGLTLRYSETEYSNFSTGAIEYEGSKFTISPSYVFTDSLSGLIEYSTYNKDAGLASISEPEELIAAEVIFTF